MSDLQKITCTITYHKVGGTREYTSTGWAYSKEDAYKDAIFQLQDALDQGLVTISNVSYE